MKTTRDMMLHDARYWLFAITTYAATRIITGSPLLAALACTITCHTLYLDDRASRRG